MRGSTPPLALALGAILAVAGLAACGADDAGTPPALDGTSWVLVDVAGRPALPSPQATLQFTKPGELGGNASCNHFGGKVEFDGDEMSVSELVQTLIGCQQPIADQEARYMRALAEAKRYELESGELAIHSRAFDEPLRFAAAVP